MMGAIGELITRFRRSGVLLLIGFFLIIYISFGFLYVQQGSQQRELEEQSTKLSLVVAKPLPDAEALQAEYDEVINSLAPITEQAALAIIVGIAEKSGIDVDPDSAKLHIAPLSVNEVKIGEVNYQVLSFSSITVQGDYESVMAFISDLDSGKTLETMVLKKVASFSQVEVPYIDEEEIRRTEFRNVSSAVSIMMTANDLTRIPNPINYAGGTATNYMGDDPDTAETTEGFPDITTTAAAKGADAAFLTAAGETEVLGYLLYGNQLITDVDGDGVYDAGDGDAVTIVNYVTMTETTYFYTCEANGTVRQFDGPDIAAATEYMGSEASKTETVATLDVDIYTKGEG